MKLRLTDITVKQGRRKGRLVKARFVNEDPHWEEVDRYLRQREVRG